jgi:hypothetical protein
MSDFSVRSENVDVEQIMRQIRARIREKRGVDYTEDEIRDLANVKLEKFIDPKGVRSGLLEEYRRVSTPEAPAPNFAFGEDTLYETHRGPIRWLRSLFRPFLKLLFNPNPLIQALHIQADLNQRNAERTARREQLDALHYEVIHNLVVELTRTGVEVKALKMRLESMASRLDFDERRARALEGVVQYRAGAVPPQQPPANQDQGRRDHGQRDQRPQHQSRPDQGRREQAPQDQWRRPSAPAPSVPASSVPGAPVEANALDADGNERRARRRRRRGRRRPGDRFGGEGSFASSPVGPSPVGLSSVGPSSVGPSPVGPTFPPSPEASAGRHSFSDGGRSDDEPSPTMPDLKVGPTGDGPTSDEHTGEGREGDDPGTPPQAARSEPAGGDSGPSES